MPDAHSVESEDWIKRGTWDLPTDMEAFLVTVSRPGMPLKQALALFMELPAAKRMPPALRRQLRLEGLLDE